MTTKFNIIRKEKYFKKKHQNIKTIEFDKYEDRKHV